LVPDRRRDPRPPGGCVTEESPMTTFPGPQERAHRPVSRPPADGPRPHAGHGWMMIVCCIPMLVIAVALVATGVANGGFLVASLGCAAMMALMMRGMGHGGGRS